MADSERNLADAKTTELLNTVLNTIRAEHNLRSDEALRQHIGVSDLTIYRWRRGEMGKSARKLIPLILEHVERSRVAA